MELTTAAALTLQGWKWGLTLSFFLYAALSAVLITVTMIDFDHQIIPDSLVLIIAALGLIYLFFIRLPRFGPSALLEGAAGFLLGGAVFLLIAVVSNGGMGGGDIKLTAALGLWFGWKLLLLTVFLSFVSGALVSAVLLLAHLRGRKDAVPFGPFIAFAAYLVSLCGNELIQWYLHILSIS